MEHVLEQSGRAGYAGSHVEPSGDGAAHEAAEPNRRHGARSRNPRPYDERAMEIEAELLALTHLARVDAPGYA